MNYNLRDLEANYKPIDIKPMPKQTSQSSIQPKKEDKGNFWTSLIPAGGGITGGAIGAGLGTLIAPGIGTILGGLIGGAIGGGGGKVAENAVEGQDLGQGVVQEALINGALSAGPLRLLKLGGEAVQGIRGGTGLAEAIANAGTKAAGSSVTQAAGQALEKAGTRGIAKEFRLNPTQQTNFKNLHGEEAVDVLRRQTINAPEQVIERIQPLQQSFNEVINKVPAVGQAELQTGLQKVYQPLLDSPVLFKQGLGQQVKAQADELMKLAEKGQVPASKINELRQEFDQAVNYTSKGAPEYNVIKQTADALRGTLQSAADKAGIKAPNGMSFKQVGQELSKLYSLNDIVGRQAYLGTGSLPLGIPNLLGIGAGSAAGGLPGAAIGALATNAVNSPLGRRLATNAAINTGEKLSAKGAANTAAAFTPKGIAKRVLPGNIATNYLNDYLSSPQSQLTTPATMNTIANPNNDQNIPSDYIMPNENASTGAMPRGLEEALADTRPQSPYPEENLRADIQRDPANADEYLALYTKFQKALASSAKAQTGPKYTSTVAGTIKDLSTGIQTLDELKGLTAGKDYAGGVIQGTLRQYNPFDVQFRQQQAIVDTARQIVGKALEGGVLRKEDEEKYKKILPTMQDSPETAISKVNYLQNILTNNLSRYTKLVSGGNSLEDILLGYGE